METVVKEKLWQTLIELLKEIDRVCKKHNIKYMLFCGSALGAVRHKGFIPWDDDLDVAMERSEYERFLKIAPEELKKDYFLQAEFTENWSMFFSKLRKNNTTCLEKYFPKYEHHQGVYIDIFPIDNASDNEFIRKIQFYCSKVVIAKSLYKRGYETDSKGKKLFMNLCRLLPLKLFHKIAVHKSAKNSKKVHSFVACTAKYKKGIYNREWITETVPMDFEDGKYPVSAHYDELLKTLYGDYMRIPNEAERKVKEHAILIDTERNYTEYADYRNGMKFEVYTRNIH